MDHADLLEMARWCDERASILRTNVKECETDTGVFMMLEKAHAFEAAANHARFMIAMKEKARAIAESQ